MNTQDKVEQAAGGGLIKDDLIRDFRTGESNASLRRLESDVAVQKIHALTCLSNSSAYLNDHDLAASVNSKLQELIEKL
ncbi:hypothetical protein HCY66_06845 [Acinetobacter radioresistens]|uniref:hypothetical protein n=1 Tax=Acinetobacter radioresistens TaxID=40216 RepID=UPI00200408D7|nr:hypothetical protein [Acinetobacter radioresistens]MCK4089802.1 hypothetical protein [Acinetobacter radioresistens]